MMNLLIALIAALAIATARPAAQHYSTPQIQFSQDASGLWGMSCLSACEHLPAYGTPDELARRFDAMHVSVNYWLWLSARHDGRPTYTPLPGPNDTQPGTAVLPVGPEFEY